jgi:hypothetical protein
MRKRVIAPAQLAAGLLLLSAAALPATALAVASAELSTTQAYFYGRFEARIRFAPGDGIVSSFFLWKDGSERAGAFWNELDFEKVGADCHMTTNARYGNPAANHSQTNTLNVDICGSYHDYRFEWTPTYLAWSVDGQEFRRDADTTTATAFAQNATAGMQFHFNVWPGNSSFGGNFNASILPVHEYISWVQYSSYANGTFTPQWKEEFNGPTLPAGWVVGNFASPFNLSVHSPANVGFVGSIAVLSVTADNATGAPGVPPPDPNATVGASDAGADSRGTGGVPGTAGTPGTAGSGGPDSGAGGVTVGVGGSGSGGSVNGGGVGGSPGSSGAPGSGGSSTGTGGAGVSASSSSGCSCSLRDSSTMDRGAIASGLGLVLLLGFAGRRQRSRG